MSRGKRPLTEEERILWSTATRAIVPLRRGASDLPARPGPQEQPLVLPRPAAAPAPVRARAQPVETSEQPAAPFDRRLKQRLGRGRQPIDARIDLHGLTQAEAHPLLESFVRAAAARGARVVLVITGKGGSSGSGPDRERGVLRRQVPHWLKAASLRDCVIGFVGAHAGHGGEGALYVRLRRSNRAAR